MARLEEEAPQGAARLPDGFNGDVKLDRLSYGSCEFICCNTETRLESGTSITHSMAVPAWQQICRCSSAMHIQLRQ